MFFLFCFLILHLLKLPTIGHRGDHLCEFLLLALQYTVHMLHRALRDTHKHTSESYEKSYFGDLFVWLLAGAAVLPLISVPATSDSHCPVSFPSPASPAMQCYRTRLPPEHLGQRCDISKYCGENIFIMIYIMNKCICVYWFRSLFCGHQLNFIPNMEISQQISFRNKDIIIYPIVFYSSSLKNNQKSNQKSHFQRK